MRLINVPAGLQVCNRGSGLITEKGREGKLFSLPAESEKGGMLNIETTWSSRRITGTHIISNFYLSKSMKFGPI